jgi:hypothetical protein
MRLSTSLSAVWLAACVLAGPQDQTTTDENGIRSIPVCLFLPYSVTQANTKIVANTFPPDGMFFSATVSLASTPDPADLGDSHIWILICKVDGGILEGIQ